MMRTIDFDEDGDESGEEKACFPADDDDDDDDGDDKSVRAGAVNLPCSRSISC